MRIRDHGAVSPERVAALLLEVAPLTTLQDVLRWAFACSPPRELVDVVIQDEFSHDVVMTGPDGLYLCFDTT
jgi:hypothetical protein